MVTECPCKKISGYYAKKYSEDGKYIVCCTSCKYAYVKYYGWLPYILAQKMHEKKDRLKSETLATLNEPQE